MAHRVFRDEQGRVWHAWTVKPDAVDRRITPAAPGSVAVERRKRHEYRVKMAAPWANGWLVFETRGEKRRLAPYPPSWSSASDAELLQLMRARATLVPVPRRLSE